MKLFTHVLSFSLLILLGCSPKTALLVTQDEEVQQKNPVIPEPIVPASEMGDKTLIEKPIPVDDRVRIGTLPNGIKYYIQQNQKPENRAELRLAVKAGSILEDPEQLGVAHFVEHMAFNGTKNFAKNELVEYLETTGTRFGPDLNAFTSFDETVYMLQVRTDSMELFDKGLLVLKDWAHGISFDEEEIDKERGVVVSEWRTRLSPDQRIQQKVLPVVLHGSRYAERLPIGDPAIIDTADYNTIRRFYKDWYRPDLMAIVVVGDVDPDKVEADIVTMFSFLPVPESKRERKEYSVPMHPETLYAVESDPEAAFTQVQIIHKHEEQKTLSLKDFRRSMIQNLYNGMLNKRLVEISKQADPPFIFANAGYGGFMGDLDSYSAFAMVPEAKALDALESLLTENKRILQHGFTETELDRQKKDILERAERSYKEMDKSESSRLSMKYVYHFLNDNPIPSPKQRYDMTRQYIPGIQLKELNQLASQWIRDESRVIVISGPEKEDAPLPTEQEIKEVLVHIGSIAVEPYVDDVVDAPLLDVDLTPGNIVQQESYDTTGITYFALNNGVEVYLKPTEFKNDEIIMGAISPGGTSLMSEEDYLSGSRATSVIRESGLGQFNSVQLNKWMSGKSVSVSPFIGSLSEGFRGGAAPKDLEVMFQLIYLYFTDIRKDEDAFTSFITRQKATYKNVMSNPSYYFSDFVSKLRYDNHPRVGWPSEEDLEKIDMEKAFALYQDRFADASDFSFYFVGNFEVDSIQHFCTKYLANLPTKQREESWKDLGIRVIPGNVNKQIKRGKAPKTQVELFFHGDFDWDPKEDYILDSALDYLRIKLREALREDKGGVYGVRLSGGASRKPVPRYSITMSFNSDPDRTQELIDEAKKVILDAKEVGPDEEDLTKVKETQRQSRIKNLEQNRFWLNHLRREIDGDRNFNAILLEKLERQLDELTAEDIKNAVKKYFDYSNFIQVVMEPESGDLNN